MPKLAEQRQKPNARVFVLTQQETDVADDIVTVTILVNSVPGFVLFNCGATHSFVSHIFSEALKSTPTYLKENY